MDQNDSTRYRISFDYKNNKVRIQRPILDVLGRPKYIKMLLSPEEKILVLLGIDNREKDCFPIPPAEDIRRSGFVLHGQNFIRRISRIAGWGLEKSQIIAGEYDAGKRAVIFDLNFELVDELENEER